MNTNKVAAQKLYCEDCHHQQVLSYYTVEAGEAVRVLDTNGYHTRARSYQQFLDESAHVMPDAPAEEVRAARERLERAGYGLAVESVYGPLWATGPAGHTRGGE